MSIPNIQTNVQQSDIEPPDTHSWTRLKSLGEGTHAKVFLVKKTEKDFFALKCFFKKEEMASYFPDGQLDLFFQDDGTPISALREWEAAQHLRHQNLLRYYELTRGVTTSLLMEWVQGKTLEDIPLKSFDLSTILALLIEGADVLQYTFDQGWINQDLYSENVMISDDQHLKIIDLESFEPLPNTDEEDETLEKIQEKLWSFFESILDKGDLSTEEKVKITQLFKILSSSPNLDSQKHNKLSPAAGPLFAKGLREIISLLEEMRSSVPKMVLLGNERV
jgi:serine/threonine protein kinase